MYRRYLWMLLVKNVNMLRLPELRKLVKQFDNLTDTRDGYSCYTQNARTLQRLLDKIMVLAKEEKEWYLYFHAIHEVLFILNRIDGKSKEVLKYAEIYYRDKELYMDMALPYYTDTNLSAINNYIMEDIFGVYRGYYQITDKKMDAFMELYKESAKKYEKGWTYYNSLIDLGLLYHDKEMVVEGKENFDKSDCNMCYICSHYSHFGYYLILDDLEGAEEFLHNIVTKNIPSKYLWSYQKCARANEQTLYGRILGYCLLLGKPEFFHKVFKERGVELFGEYDIEAGTSYILYHMLTKDVDATHIEKDMEQAAEDIELEKKQTTTTLGSIFDFLCWYCYFLLLEKYGILTIKADCLKSVGLETEEDGTYLVCKLKEYYKEQADRVGEKFGKSRKRFSYKGLKESYKACIQV